MKWFMGLVTWLWSGLVVCEEEQTTDGSAGEGDRGGPGLTPRGSSEL